MIEWNGIPLVGKGAAEVQAIVDTPADEVELLVRMWVLLWAAFLNSTQLTQLDLDDRFINDCKLSIFRNPSESLRYPSEYPHHTCSRRSPCRKLKLNTKLAFQNLWKAFFTRSIMTRAMC